MSSFPLFSQAAHYGCGCWAENACNMNPYSTAVSTSGIPQHTLYNLLRSCVCLHACVTFPLTVNVYRQPVFCFGDDMNQKQIFDVRPLI